MASTLKTEMPREPLWAIPGLDYIPSYLSALDQDRLLTLVDQCPWQSQLKRRVQHYGCGYNYRTRHLDQSVVVAALPDWALKLADRLYAEGCLPQLPDQMAINEYQPGQGITPHVDCVPCFGETILSLSLGSACVMNFTSLKGNRRVSLLLQPGSLLVMRDEARYQWKHGIAARKTDQLEGVLVTRHRRVSLTLRKATTH